jgi:dihydroneopterin aldolase
LTNDHIRIHNAVFYAYHGVAQDEQKLGGKFEVDVDMTCDLSAAMTSDGLSKTVDYEAVYGVVQKAVTGRKHYLLESVAHTIAIEILNGFPRVDEVAVKVRKPHPPVKGVVDCVEIEITKRRL